MILNLPHLFPEQLVCRSQSDLVRHVCSGHVKYYAGNCTQILPGLARGKDPHPTPPLPTICQGCALSVFDACGLTCDASDHAFKNRHSEDDY